MAKDGSGEMLGAQRKKEWIQIAIASVLIILITVPMIALVLKMNPSADDFFIAYRVKLSGLSMFEGGWQFMLQSRIENSGGYFSLFFTFLAPLNFYGLQGIIVVCMINLLAFFTSLLILARSFIKCLFQTKAWSVTLWFYVAALFLMTQFLNPNEFFYWYTGSTAYVIPMTATFLFLASLIKLVTTSGHKLLWTALTSVAVFCAAGNQITFPIFCVLIMLAVWGNSMIKKDANRKWLTIVFIVLVIGVVINLSAPGYFSRQDMETSQTGGVIGGKTLIWWILNDAVSVGSSILFYTGVPFVLLLLLPLMVKLCRKTSYGFRHPIWFTLFQALIFLALIFPYRYGMGAAGIPNRYMSTLYCLAMLLVFMEAFYIVGWATKKYDLSLDSAYRKGAAYLMAFVALGITVHGYPVANWTSYNIVANYANGVIQTTQRETQRVLSEIENSDEDIVIVDRPAAEYPFLNPIHMRDENDPFFINTAVANFLGKEYAAYRALE